MPKLLEIHNGYINFFDGYNLALAGVDGLDAVKRQSNIAHLSALKKHILKLKGVKDLEGLTSLNALITWEELQANLVKENVSYGYCRSLKSAFGKVVAAAPKIPTIDTSQVEAVHALFRKNNIATDGPGAVAFFRFFEFLQRTHVDLTDGDAIALDFVKYLESHYKISPLGQCRNNKRFIKSALKSCGVPFKEIKTSPRFPHLESQIEAIKSHLFSNSTPTAADQKPVKRKLQFPTAGEPKKRRSRFDRTKKLRPATWIKTERCLRILLNFLRDRLGSEKFNSLNLVDLLTIANFQDFLDDKYEQDAYTMATVRTYIDSVTRVCVEGWNAKAGGFEKLSCEVVDTTVSQMWSWYYSVATEFKKPGVREKIREAGGLPSYNDLFSHCLKSLTKELTVQNDYLEEMSFSDNGKQQHTLRQIALSLARCVEAALIITFAPRLSDTFNTIKISSISKTKDGSIILNYFPSKTSNRDDPCLVKACVPEWFATLFEVYVTQYHHLIYPNAQLLFPANYEMKVRHEHLAKEGEARMGNHSEARARISRKFFGQDICANDLRKSLISFFAGKIQDCHRYTGHKPDARNLGLTKIELDNYYYPDDHQIIESDKFIHSSIKNHLNLMQDQIDKIRELSMSLNPHKIHQKRKIS